jgi:hypothetical protein
MADRCSFCGSTAGPFTRVEGLFTVLMCADCQAARGHGSGPYPVMTRAEMRAGLELLPTWALEQKAAPTARSSRSCVSAWLPASKWLACTRSRDWPGWSDKPRSPRASSPSARQQRSATADTRVTHDGLWCVKGARAPRVPERRPASHPCQSRSMALLHQGRVLLCVAVRGLVLADCWKTLAARHPGIAPFASSSRGSVQDLEAEDRGGRIDDGPAGLATQAPEAADTDLLRELVLGLCRP